VSAWDDFALVGRVARAHGHRGQVIVDLATDFAEERFAAGATVWRLSDDGPLPVRVLESRMHMGRPVLTLEGIESMNDAVRLRGVELRVPAAELRSLPRGSHYHHDLVGCTLTTVGGRVVGVVRAVEGRPGAERLVIGEGRGEVQVPLVDAICVEIDVVGRRIVVDPPEGLLELNA
jgi:16S rRNA processing protein RimM